MRRAAETEGIRPNIECLTLAQGVPGAAEENLGRLSIRARLERR